MKLWILLLVASLSLVCWQEAMAESHTWMSLGGGGAELGGRGMPGGRIGVHWWQGKSMWTVSLAGFAEVDILGTRSPHESVTEFGALYGQRWGGRVGFVSLGAGLSVLGGTHRGRLLSRSGFIFYNEEYEAKHFTTVGFPLNVEFALMPFKTVGIALGGFYNINLKYPFGGATLSLLLGQVR